MKNFSEYVFEKDKQELIDFLLENNINLDKIDITNLIETGWWDRTKQGLKKGLKAGLLAAPLLAGANFKQPSELPNPKPYSFIADKLLDNEQSAKDQQADKAYMDAGGPEFKQTLEDAQKFAKFQLTSQHKEILRRAGLPSNYMPSKVRSFTYGDKISTMSQFEKESVRIIQGEIKKHFGRDSFIRLIKSEDSVTGGSVISLDVTGTVMAFDENDAIKRVEMVIREIAKDNGYDLQGFKDMSGHHGIEVRPASRSTIDYVQETSGVPIKFSVRIKLKV